MFQLISIRQLEQYLEENRDFVLLDVRSLEEFRAGHLKHAVNIPMEELGLRVQNLDRSRPVVVYCRSGSSSMMAARYMDRLGYTVSSLVGGLSRYHGRFYVDSYL